MEDAIARNRSKNAAIILDRCGSVLDEVKGEILDGLMAIFRSDDTSHDRLIKQLARYEAVVNLEEELKSRIM